MPATYYTQPSSTDSSLLEDNVITSISMSALQANPAIRDSRPRNGNLMSKYLSASSANLFDQRLKKPENGYYLDYLQDSTVRLIKDIIRSCELDDTFHFEQAIYKLTEGNEDILGKIALQKDELINVRGMAARLLFARVQNQEYKQLRRPNSLRVDSLCRLIEKHESPLIRLGVVLGYADAGVWNRVRDFCNNQHPVVAQRARELLEDAD